MVRFKLGIVLETVGKPARVALTDAAKLEIAGVQIDANGEFAPDSLGTTARREVRTLLGSMELELAAVMCPLRRGLDSSEDQQRRIEHVRKVMQFAADLGPSVVVAPMPRIPTDATSPRALTLRETLLDLGAFGDRLGVRLALEVGLDPGDKVRDYLAGFDTGGLAVTFDPANFLLNGFDPLGSLAALAGRWAYMQARDARTATVSGPAQEVPVGAGDIEWMVMMATLESTGYTGFITVDRETGNRRFADVSAGVKFLRRYV